MKYYYTDPLAAAWMAKHFGMAFDIFAQPSGVRVEKEKSTAKYIAMLGDAYRCYIHPDSLHLLEPKVGDLLLDDDPTDGANRTWHLEGMPDAIKAKWNIIIQRNGIAFMWPEVEE